MLVYDSKEQRSASVLSVLASCDLIGFNHTAHVQPQDLDPDVVVPSFPALHVMDGNFIFSSAAIARYLALNSQSVQAYPGAKDAKKSADIDAWMAFALRTVAPISDNLSKHPDPSDQVYKLAKIDLISVLSQSVEPKLATSTYIVSGSKDITLADMFLAASCAGVYDIIASSGSLPNTTRYLNSVLNSKVFQPYLKKTVSSSSSSSSASPTTVASFGNVVPLPGQHPRHHRNRIQNILQIPDERLPLKDLVVSGWCKTVRISKGPIFVELSDGSSSTNLQIVAHKSTTDAASIEVLKTYGTTGAAFSFVGELIKSPAAGQRVEFQAHKVTLLGGIPDPEAYPLAKTRIGHSLEYLREIGHLRPRTNIISASMRVRSCLAFAVHKFFRERGFTYVHTPIITASDCEGAGEMFQVTTIMQDEAKLLAPPAPPASTKKIDYSEDFFKKPAFLTVSGQLNGECYATALSEIYTFGPTFRAEKSNTHRHLAEFWMIEPEIAFATLKDDMDLAEDFLKYCIKVALEECAGELEFFEAKEIEEKGEVPMKLRDRLQRLIRDPFVRLTYSKGVEILLEHIKDGKVQFTNFLEWGTDLATEHERYLTEKVYDGTPVILTHYPAHIKAFYMRMSRDDPRCVEAMDILCPHVGEIMGGSAREDNLDLLDKRIVEMGLHKEDFSWYRELRRYGSVPHAGFGMGFERLVMLVTAIHNIRDVIPFPRYPDHCDF